MTVLYVGDTHGFVEAIAYVDSWANRMGASAVIQVGDFGIHWPGAPCSVANFFHRRLRRVQAGRFPPIPWYTCFGNHDNWEWALTKQVRCRTSKPIELAPLCYFVPRAATLVFEGKKHLFLGGAESTDRHVRVEGKSWWSEETPQWRDFDAFHLALETERPDVVVTHDSPNRVEVFKEGRDWAPTPLTLEKLLASSSYAPPIWYFGHHHVRKGWLVGETEFRCCGLHGQFWASDLQVTAAGKGGPGTKIVV